jgi:Fe-S-cluster-containing hydrogenase component 2
MVESGSGADARLRYVSMACMHCENARCLSACPTGAIAREPGTRVVKVGRPDFCIGCHSCSDACPFGVPRFGRDGRMQKCDLCSVRLENGLEPACVRVCPTKALNPNAMSSIGRKRRPPGWRRAPETFVRAGSERMMPVECRSSRLPPADYPATASSISPVCPEKPKYRESESAAALRASRWLSMSCGPKRPVGTIMVTAATRWPNWL